MIMTGAEDNQNWQRAGKRFDAYQPFRCDAELAALGRIRYTSRQAEDPLLRNLQIYWKRCKKHNREGLEIVWDALQ